MAELTVLVLGVGGNVSQGIQKSLALSALPLRVLGACTEARAAGLFAAEHAYVSPAAADPEFLPWLLELCEAEGVGAILSGVEPVLATLAAHAREIEHRTGAVCVVSPPSVLEIGQDKLETCRWLRARGLPFPRFAESSERDELDRLAGDCGYPLLAKPRRGKGGRGVRLIEGERELGLIAGREDLVVQGVVGEPGGEYTTGCLCDREGALRGTLVMRRELLEGTTYRAEALDEPDTRDVAERIARALGPVGPVNVQSRLVEGRSVPFELNVRFSGTTPLRARLGFNEVEAALRHLVLGERAIDLPRITSGIGLRYWNEVYVIDDEVTWEDWALRPDRARTGRRPAGES